MANRKAFLQPEPLSVELNDSMVTLALKVFEGEPIDLHDADAVRERIVYYFSECSRLQLRPSNLGLYAFLGMSKQDVSNVLTGKSKSKVSPECIDLLKKAKIALGTYREQLALNGKVNPVVALFWGKNFDHLTDVQQLEVSRSDQERFEPHMTPEEIAEQVRLQIEQDIPIDGDYQEQ